MADTWLIKRKCVALCVEDGDRVPVLDLCRFQFTTSVISIEEKRNFSTFDIKYLHLQTKECGGIHNLSQKTPMPSRSRGNHVAALVENRINEVLARKVNKAGEGCSVPKIC